MIRRAWNWIRSGQVWRSIWRHGLPRDVGAASGRAPSTSPREYHRREMVILNNLFLHIHPTTIRRSALRFSFTWGMGLLTFFLFVIEAVTGVLLMFYYRPSVEYAYFDIQAMRNGVVSMGLIREIHRWGAHAMVIAVWLHMLRVFLTGSYKPPREFNWVVGVVLLVLTMLLSFTGYLLPWDQLSMWAVTVGTNMAGAAPLLGYQGPLTSLIQVDGVPLVHPASDVRFALLAGTSVGPSTLLRFYVLHCVFLPLIAAILIAVHFWRVRKDGGISGPP